MGDEHGCEPDHHQRRDQFVSEMPAAEIGGVERARTRRQQAEAIAPLGRRGARPLFIGRQDLDAVGVDDDVLARREEGDDDGEKRGQSEIFRRAGLAQRQDGKHKQRLDKHQPAAPASKYRGQPRQRQPVDRRRPDEFPVVGEPDQDEETDRGPRHALLGEPQRERGKGKRKRQPAREPHEEDDEQPLLAVDAERLEPSGHRSGLPGRWRIGEF